MSFDDAQPGSVRKPNAEAGGCDRFGTGLHHATALEGREGRYTARLSEHWDVKGPNGGYLSAIALRAAGASCPFPYRPVSMSTQYLTRAPTRDVEVTVHVGRPGRWVRCLNVEIKQGRHVLLHSQVWASKREDGPELRNYTPPEAIGAGPPTIGSSTPPVEGFQGNFEFVRPAAPASGPEARIQRWVRYRDFEAGGDLFAEASRSLVLIDCFVWPAYLEIRQGPPEFAVSLDLSAHFHAPTCGSDWLFVDACAHAVGGGVISGAVRVWTQDGRLAASGASQMLHWPA
jgi:acyl-CoA thioesterase